MDSQIPHSPAYCPTHWRQHESFENEFGTGCALVQGWKQCQRNRAEDWLQVRPRKQPGSESLDQEGPLQKVQQIGGKQQRLKISPREITLIRMNAG